MPARLRSSGQTLVRQFIFLLLLFPLQRYLAELLPLTLPLALFAAVWAARLAGRRFGLPDWAAALCVVPGLVLAAVGVLWVAVTAIGADGWWEEQLVLSGWRLLPAAVMVVAVTGWDLWYVRFRSGRQLFVPLVAVGVTLVFWSQARFRTDLLGHPTWYAVYGLATATLVVVHQLLAPTPVPVGGTPGTAADESRTAAGAGRRSLVVRRTVPVALLLILLLSSLVLVYRGWQGQAVEAGGGLLRPTAFRFDFADYVTLEPEIRLSRDLVFLYREAQAPPDRLLRRYVLSGYAPRRGFFRLDPGDEPATVPPLSVDQAIRDLPGTPDANGPSGEGSGIAVDQEYYVVNFDPDAFIAVNAPQSAEGLRSWSRSSFNRAYRVRSRRPATDPDELATRPWPQDLPEEWRAVYLGGPVPTAVADLAREVTAGVSGYYETVIAVRDYLLNGYYYSLSPGEAVAGDQLQHFLFESRKGYCSYFAFSMALMLRSLGVPTRVAVGFFVDPAAGMLGFYPVRGDMAHAWVEVWFPGSGWVEFDPTSTTIAPGESVNTDYRIDQERLSALIQEILSQGDLATQDGSDDRTPAAGAAQLRRRRSLAVVVILVIAAPVWWWFRRRRRWRRLCAANPRRAALILTGRIRRLRGTEPVQTLRARFAREFGAGDLATVDREWDRVLTAALRGARRSGEAASGDNASDDAASDGGGRRRVLTRGLPAIGRFALIGWMRAVPPPVSRRARREDPHRWTRGGSAGGPAAVAVLFAVVAFIVAVQPAEAQLPDTATDGPAAQDEGGGNGAGDAAELLGAARDAMDAENYEVAIRMLRDGASRYPTDHRFPLLLGDLYFDQGLYEVARDAYRDALAAGAPDYSTRYILSRTLSRLNEDAAAITLLEALHRTYRDDLTVIGDLAWLYFKTHRLEEARDLLVDAIAEFGPDRDLCMTLATVYSGLWRYDDALREYRTSIELAERADDRIFQAVAYYNLSILHANFYRYDEALAAAERSLEMAERPSGYMIRAELRELQLAEEDAAADYNRAAVLDEFTPLAHLSLAALWTDAGYPDRAIARLDRITGENDPNWMYNYGTDPDRYLRQVYTAYADAWEARAHQLRLQRPGDVGARLLQRFRAFRARVIGWYYRGLERRQRRRVADAYGAQGRELLSEWNRMQAAEEWPRIALRHAARAETIETRFNPEAAIDYRLFAAGITDDRRRLAELAATLQSPWRRDDRATALRGVYRAAPRRPEGLQAAARAWALAPGTFLVNGLRVPVTVATEATDAADAGAATGGLPPISEARQRRVLRRMGFRTDDDAALVLELTWEDGSLAYRVWDRRLDAEIRRGAVSYGSGSSAATAAVSALEQVAETLTRAGESVLGVEAAEASGASDPYQ